MINKGDNLRRKILAANWKMNMRRDEAKSLLSSIKKMEIKEGREEIVFVPSVYLEMCENALKDTKANYGVQNVYSKEKGAFTGEISALQVKDFGVEYVLVGHSERRNIFNEDGKLLNEKIKMILSAGLTPVLCVGEPLSERENKTYEAYLYKELKEAMDGVSIEDAKKIIYAYEPIWAIGTGKTAKIGEIKKTLEFLRNTLDYIYEGVKEDVHLLYGGSVNKDNIDEIVNTDHVDGVLVGGASLKADDWERILNFEVK